MSRASRISRVPCLLLALYAFAVFGYVAATLSTFFIERDAADDQAEIAGAKSINDLRQELSRCARKCVR